MSFLTRRALDIIVKEKEKKESQEAEKTNLKKRKNIRKEVIKTLLN